MLVLAFFGVAFIGVIVGFALGVSSTAFAFARELNKCAKSNRLLFRSYRVIEIKEA